MNIYKIWVGDHPVPDAFTPYTDTWHVAGTEHRIIDVGNQHVDMYMNFIDSRLLTYAVANKKWPLVNHYIRYALLFHVGGIYMDLDVQVVRPFALDMGYQLHIGMESERWVNNCVMICGKPGHKFFKDCMDYMDAIDFDMPEIELETGPRLVTNLIERHTRWCPGLMDCSQVYQYQKDDYIYVHPERTFSPHRWYQTFHPDEIKADTFTVHHYHHSWK